MYCVYLECLFAGCTDHIESVIVFHRVDAKERRQHASQFGYGRQSFRQFSGVLVMVSVDLVAAFAVADHQFAAFRQQAGPDGRSASAVPGNEGKHCRR